MTETDLIIIGAGPGGYETAARAAASGLRTILFERDQLGGTCLNRGCIPTKCLAAAAAVADTVGHAATFGIKVGEPEIDFPAVLARKDEVVSGLREGVAAELKGVTVVSGEASFTSGNTVEANGETYTAPRIIIATGSRPALPPVDGIDLALTSDGLLALDSLPESLAIIGGGVIGMEFASIFTSFGVKVTVIEFCREILPPFDSEVAKRLRMSLKRRGICIITSARVNSVEREGDGFKVNYSEKGKDKSVSVSLVAVATGRSAVVPAGFVEAGGKVDACGRIVTDDNFATSIPGIYAIGDASRGNLAHEAVAQGRRVLGDEMVDTWVVPSVVFTAPECAMVGLTEEAAAEKGIEVVVGKSTFRANGKAVTAGETDGMVKVIADAADGRILGAHICGPHAADLIQEMTLAVKAGLTAAEVLGTIHPHPTLSEAVAAAIPVAE